METLDTLLEKLDVTDAIENLTTIINDNKKIFLIFMEKCIIVSKKFPPKYNENKFIYGKLIEHLLVRFINETANTCILLDENKIQSNYKYDILVNDKYFYSIKVTKNRNSQIRIINTHSDTVNHVFSDINMVIVNLERLEIYIFNTSLLPIDFFVIRKDGIDIKSKFYKYINKNHRRNVIQLKCKIAQYEKLEALNFYPTLLHKIDEIHSNTILQ